MGGYFLSLIRTLIFESFLKKVKNDTRPWKTIPLWKLVQVGLKSYNNDTQDLHLSLYLYIDIYVCVWADSDLLWLKTQIEEIQQRAWRDLSLMSSLEEPPKKVFDQRLHCFTGKPSLPPSFWSLAVSSAGFTKSRRLYRVRHKSFLIEKTIP